MKKLYFILFICTAASISRITAQGIHPKMVYRGDINNIENQKGEIQNRSVKKIELLILDKSKLPSTHARIHVKELDEVYGCDSLGNLTIELPDSLLKLNLVHITITDRIRINSYEVKLYKREIIINMNDVSKKRKIILNHYKKRKSGFVTVTPSF